MSRTMKVLLAYDGTGGAKQALEDLKRNRAGLPAETEVAVLTVAEALSVEGAPSFGAYGLGDMPITESQLRYIEAARRLALKRARKTAQEAARQLQARRPAWKVQAAAVAGPVAWSIIKWAETWKPDLLVVGVYGRGPVGRFVLGSVAQSLVREAGCAVRVVRGRVGKPDESASLIIGLDGSAGAMAAVEAVAARKWPPGTAVRVVTALDAALTANGMTLPFERGYEPTWVRRRIDEAVRRLRGAGLAVTPETRRADARKALIAEARRWGADGVFVGARGLTGIRRFLLGSVSTAVAMGAPCTVEVARPARRAAAVAPSQRNGHGRARRWQRTPIII
jgi:nucleotide-binding universal stress UspA family protein